MNKLFYWLILLCLVLLTGCNSATDIEKIVNNKEQYKDQYVKISGFVTSRINVPLVDNDVFKVDDHTGAIWAYTTKGSMPEEGMRVTVHGTFRKFLSIPLVNFEAEYYIELHKWE